MTTLNEIKINLDRIKETLLEADVAFRMYCHILKMKGSYRRIGFYNKHIVIFHYQQNSFLYDSIMKITKLCEPPTLRNGRDKNTTLLYLNDELFKYGRKEEQKEIKKLLSYIKNKIKRLDKIRNKEIAHLDRNSTRQKVFNESTGKVRKILNRQLTLLNIYNRILYRISYQSIYFEPRIGDELKKFFGSLFNEYKNSLDKTEKQKELDYKIHLDAAKYRFQEYVNRESKFCR